MTLLDELKAQQRRAKKKAKKKASKKRKKKARKKASKKRVRSLSAAASKTRVAKLRAAGYKVSRLRMPDGTIVVLRSKKKAKKKAAKKRKKKRGEAIGAYSFGALMRRGGKRKINVERTRARIRNLYKQGELAQANKLRAKLKAAGYDYK